MKKVFTIFVVFLIVSFVTAFFPYPIFSRYTNITGKEATLINNFRESEIKVNSKDSIKVLDLKFNQISSIFPTLSKFEIEDLSTNLSFVAIRTGGRNHFDIEPADAKNAEIITQIAQISSSNTTDTPNIAQFSKDAKETPKQIWSWKKIPVLLKLNDFSFIPASLALYPHGFSTNSTSFNGHLCLHFFGSRTDGTNRVDDTHQKNIKIARKQAECFFKENTL